jgi:hypothetical protein
MHSRAVDGGLMSTRGGWPERRRATVQVPAALVACLLALTLTTITRSHPGQHHVNRVAAVGVVSSDVSHGLARIDQHAVTAAPAVVAATLRVARAEAQPVTVAATRTPATPRERGPPGRAA